MADLDLRGDVGQDPVLTSVVIPVDDIARRIVDRTLWQIENGQDNAPGEIVATWLREGGSTPARS